MSDIKKPELLAPAGSPEALYAAVSAGADAVYLGLSKFNARVNASNLGMEELKDCLSPESEMVETYEAGGYEYTRVTRSRSYITYPLNS